MLQNMFLALKRTVSIDSDTSLQSSDAYSPILFSYLLFDDSLVSGSKDSFVISPRCMNDGSKLLETYVTTQN